MRQSRRSQQRSPGLDGVLSGLARSLQAEPNVETTLAGITKAALDHIGGEAAGVSLLENGRIRTVAPTSELVVTADELQYRHGEGPCVDAIREHSTYRTGDLGRETRWPRYAPAAVRAGAMSMLSYRLFITNTTLGALNLYSSLRDAFDDRAEQDGLLFASHAAVALIGAQTEQRLHTALDHRDTIGMAKGILMERHDLDPEAAFNLLVRTSQETNLKLHAIAEWLVGHRHDRNPGS